MGRGWAWPDASKYAHYYIDCQSVCLTSAYFENDLEDFEDGSPDNCYVCQRKVWRLRTRRKQYKYKGLLKVSIGEIIGKENEERIRK